jgi:3-phenylpropionate/cinnamic acid dioxygenase small subunit
MNSSNYALDPTRQLALEQFYYREARLLDSRQYQQWLALLSPDISYVMPSRHNVQVDNRRRDTEAMLSIENELEDADSMGCPLREESIIHLTLRVERAFKMNSWSENPPPRTRRIIGNIEALEASDQELQVVSNFHLHYSRPGSATTFYSGQRRDSLLIETGGELLIAQRVVIMDYATIEAPTFGLLF